jgi:acetyl esterase
MRFHEQDEKPGGKMIGKIYLERGKPVTVLVRWKGKGKRNVLIQREDGSKVVRPFRGLRKPEQ